MKNKHLVFFEADDFSPSGWYKGLSSFISNSSDGRNRGTKEEATWLTQKQAKRLIDKCRHAKMVCWAEPSFTIVY